VDPVVGRVEAFYSGVNTAGGVPIYHFSSPNPALLECAA
jgi:hypothetical protein